MPPRTPQLSTLISLTRVFSYLLVLRVIPLQLVACNFALLNKPFQYFPCTSYQNGHQYASSDYFLKKFFTNSFCNGIFGMPCQLAMKFYVFCQRWSFDENEIEPQKSGKRQPNSKRKALFYFG